ncbi:MAG: shikimate kinase [Elusimicrobiota bacterium]
MPRRAANIFLIGFMAAGKTAVGRALAERLKRPFIDADREIEKAAGLSVARIFARHGEKRFRALERRVINKIARQRGLVVAVGGGAVLRRSGTVVYLQAPFETLWRRGSKERAKRPLWNDRRSLLRLLQSRRPRYRRAAHLTVRAGAGTPGTIAARICRRTGFSPRRG